ncbi:MAG: hypothetical protein ACREDV_04740, partial [Methylocella sp.]
SARTPGQEAAASFRVEAAQPGDTPTPPRRTTGAVPFAGELTAARKPPGPASPGIIAGAQPVLPPGFSAYAGFDQ